MLTRDALRFRDLYIINNLKDDLKPVYIDFFIELYTYKKCKLAYENLSMQIFEFNILITEKVFNELNQACLFYKVKEHYWKKLEHLVVKD